MRPTLLNERPQDDFSHLRNAVTIMTTIGAWIALLSILVAVSQRDLSRNALWEVVHNVCVPGQSLHHQPDPCLEVSLNEGIEHGFAILKDPRGGIQFLLIPTIRISGIESPIVLEPNATNYFADAWEDRTRIEEALHLTVPRDDIGLVVNSAASRSQDQLHIHFSCIRADVWSVLHAHEAEIGNKWAGFGVPLVAHRDVALWLPGEHLGLHNPFRLLAEGVPNAMEDMGHRTLVVIGLTRPGGTEGFVILANEANREHTDFANGEELLDNACQIAVGQKRVP